MNKFRVSIDRKRWNDAIEAYIGYTHKTAEEATFRQAKNLLFFLSKELPKAKFKKKQPVAKLSDYFGGQEWVAGMLVSRLLRDKGTLIKKEGYHTHKGVTGRAYMTKNNKGKLKFAGWQKGSGTVKFTKEMAKKKNLEIKRTIGARFGFVQLLPTKAIEHLRKTAEGNGIKIGSTKLSGDKPNKKFKGAPSMVTVVRKGSHFEVEIISAYDYKSSKTLFGKPMGQNAEWYNQQFQLAMPRAFSGAIADMRRYIAKKLAQKKELTPADEVQLGRLARRYSKH